MCQGLPSPLLLSTPTTFTPALARTPIVTLTLCTTRVMLIPVFILTFTLTPTFNAISISTHASASK